MRLQQATIKPERLFLLLLLLPWFLLMLSHGGLHNHGYVIQCSSESCEAEGGESVAGIEEGRKNCSACYWLLMATSVAVTSQSVTATHVAEEVVLSPNLVHISNSAKVLGARAPPIS